MELVFYPEAAEITGATLGSVYQAVSRGDLTRAGKKGRKLCLIKEQLELFRGKDISYNSLSETDKATWHRCAKAFTPQESVSSDDLSRAREEAIQEFRRELKRESRAHFAKLFNRFLREMDGEDDVNPLSLAHSPS